MEDTKTTIEGEVEKAITSNVSPYRLAKIVSVIGGHEVRPQMLYNYVKNGMLKVETNQLGHKEVTKFEARAFARKFIGKNGDGNLK